MKLNIYDLRIVNNSTDRIFHLDQYGNSESEISEFWKNYLDKNNCGEYTFIDCKLKEKDIEVEYK